MFSPIFPSLLKMTSSDAKVRCEHCSSSASSSHQLATIHPHNQIPLYPNLLLLNALYPQLNQQSQRVESQLALKSYCNSSQSSLLSELFKVSPHHASGASGEAHSTAAEHSRPPLTSAAKRRHRRKRNQLKRYAYLASTVAATTASMLDANRSASAASTSSSNFTFAKRKTHSPTNAPLIYNHNSFNCNHSNADHFYNYYNASSNKIKSYSRYVYHHAFTLFFYSTFLVIV